MRTVQLITQASGGPVDHAVDVAGELARLGHESHLLGPLPAEGPAGRQLRRHGAHLHEVTCDGVRDLRGIAEVRSRLRALDADVVHCQDRRAGLLGRTVSTRRAQATVYTLHGVPDPFSQLVQGNLRAAPPQPVSQAVNMTAESLLARTPRSRVVTPCEALADYARDHLRIPPDRVRTVHNGLGTRWTESSPVDRDGARPGELQLAWLGLLGPVKRVPALVHAVAAVPGVRLRLIGDGPERESVEAAVREHHVGDRVELVGFLPDPTETLRSADALVLPSAAEACPIALLQGMALGLPVVASRVGGVPEIVRHGREGLLFPTGDHDALVAALTTLRDDPTLRAALGTAAALRVRTSFALQHCVGALVDVYEEVCA